MTDNNIFTSHYSLSNPFNPGTQSTSIDNSLLESYAKLEELKRNQLQNNQKMAKASVFSDIENEFKDLQDDEISFIINSDKYKSLNDKYQTEFSQFLISKFSNEFIQTTNSKTPEELLYEIKNQKEKYKSKFTKDINEIKDQNKALMEQNNALVNSNQSLQEQLSKIQEKLKWTE